MDDHDIHTQSAWKHRYTSAHYGLSNTANILQTCSFWVEKVSFRFKGFTNQDLSLQINQNGATKMASLQMLYRANLA